MQFIRNSQPKPCADGTARRARGVTFDSVILAGAIGPNDHHAFGRHRATLPLVKGNLIQKTIDRLFASGSETCTVCSNGKLADLETACTPSSKQRRIDFSRDAVPRGTAGCIKDSEPNLDTEFVFVVGAALWFEDLPSMLVQKHIQSGNSITVFCTKTPVRVNGSRWFQPAGIYILNRAVLDLIPESGFFDIKEQLVPAAQRAGLQVGAIEIDHESHEVVNWSCYMKAMEKELQRIDVDGSFEVRELAPGIWCGKDVTIAQSARIVGPVLIGSRCVIGDNALIMGPSVLADDTRVGESACLIRVVLTDACTLPPGVHVADQLIANSTQAPPHSGKFAANQNKLSNGAAELPPAESAAKQLENNKRNQLVRFATGATLIIAAFMAAFWNTINDLLQTYEVNAEASAGALVPFAAAYMVYADRSKWPKLTSLSAVGVAVFGVGLCLNLWGTYFLYASVANVGMITAAIGIILGLIGWQGFKKIWYPSLFLFLMCPPPGRLTETIMLPLQKFGALLSGYVLETFGIASERTGHVLEVAGHAVAVADACSGLRMVTSSLIVAGVLAYIITAPGWQRALILLSSLPIALACNVIRISVTAALIAAGHQKLAEGIFHTLTGMLMMPIMLVLLVLELRICQSLARLSRDRESSLPLAGVLGAAQS